MRVVVTGCAGFIGSALTEALLARGDAVLGIDSFTPYYDIEAKRRNVLESSRLPGFELLEADLRTLDLVEVLRGADVVFHQAAQPGVRLSWSAGFEEYATQNVLATQRMLEAAVAAGVPRVVFASSSSVYGQADRYPTTENDLPRPHSPYGVTKLAAEHLCGLYAANYGLSTVALRYFTVYGPRQRPDMAIHRIIEAGLTGQSFPLFGDGSAVRDFTFVDDVVSANLAAASADVPAGSIANVAGGGEISMRDLLTLVGDITGAPIPIDHRPRQAGDVDRTGGSIEQAARLLDWKPQTSLEAGVRQQVDAHRHRSRPGGLGSRAFT